MQQAVAVGISLVPGAAVRPTAAGEWTLSCSRGRIVMRQAGPGFAAGLRRLAGTVLDLDAFCAELDRAGDDAGARRLRRQVRRLAELGLAGPAVASGGRRLLVQAGRGAAPAAPVAVAGDWQLSRFAWARRAGAQLVLESPHTPSTTYLAAPPAAGLLAALAGGAGPDALAEACGAPRDAGAAMLGLLAAAGVVTPVRPAGGTGEDGEPDLATWEFHDLLFHSATRGRHRGGLGGTYRFAGRLAPPPVTRPPVPGAPRLPLPVPAAAGGPPLFEVLERRRSVRAFGQDPPSAAQLGEVLYRSARVQRVAGSNPPGLPSLEVSLRPYPGGGAVHPLEIYLLVRRCRGLEAGLYHYDPGEHCLQALPAGPGALAPLAAAAAAAAGVAAEPPLLAIFTARFARASWKYEGIAYALVLKEVGALMQTMQLAAAAAGLAACPLGAGDADAFAAAAGTAYHAESSVGEMMLGTPAGPD